MASRLQVISIQIRTPVRGTPTYHASQMRKAFYEAGRDGADRFTFVVEDEHGELSTLNLREVGGGTWALDISNDKPRTLEIPSSPIGDAIKKRKERFVD